MPKAPRATRAIFENLGIRVGEVFTPHSPIDEKSLFAGRAEQLRQVLDAVNQKGRHAIVYGERGVGKTSLANVLSSYFRNPRSTVLSPRINCTAADTFSSLWRNVFSEIEMHKPAAGFSESFSRYSSADLLPPTGEVSPDQVRRLLSALAMNSVPILIIDEFDRLKQKTKRAIADAVKTLSDHAVGATLVLVGVADTVDELIEEHQSVERALLQIRMPRMSNREIAQIVKTGLKRLTMSIDDPALQRIVALSQGLPHYTHSLGLFGSRMALDSGTKRVTLRAVDGAINKALAEAQQSIRSAWHTATVSARRDALFSEVLMACALAKTDQFGFFAAQHVREPLSEITGKRYEIPSFAQHLNDFSDAKRGNILEKRGGRRNYRYRFNNPLMQPFAIMQGFSLGKISGSMLHAETED